MSQPDLPDPPATRDPKAGEDLRLSGRAASPQTRVPTYQEALDEALDDTFPASDPPSTSVATHVHRPCTTGRDAHDWTLDPGASVPPKPAAPAGGQT